MNVNIVKILRKISVKKYAFILIIICFIFQLIGYKFNNSGGDIVKVNIDYVTVHFDLKGSPPMLTYMMNLLPTLKNYGVNSILMEYEDMFPYEGNLANLSSEIAYTKTELTDFLLEAKKLEIEVIPLIQTFGHMEFVLKLAEFSVHRELPYNPGEICPSQPGSLELIRNMLTQVITFHNFVQPIKYIHVGCDEVYNINDCPNCIRRNLKNHQIYYKHLINVKNIVNDLSPNTKVLFWSEFNYSQKRINLKYELKDYKHELNDLEPIDWEYVGERVNSARLYRMHEVFNRVWFATAFKGADDVHGKEPDIMKRYLNHIHWLSQVLTYKPPKYNVKINGIVLTGWSRYSHFARQCELLPFSMPSLILNLLLIKLFREGINRDFLYKYNHCQIYERFIKKDFEKVYATHASHVECSFRSVSVAKLKYPNYKSCLARIEDIRTDWEIYSLTNLQDMTNTVEMCNDQLRNGIIVMEKLKPLLSEFYRKEVIDNYLNETINFYDTKVGDGIKEFIMKIMNFTFLPRRSFGPLPIIKYGD